MSVPVTVRVEVPTVVVGVEPRDIAVEAATVKVKLLGFEIVHVPEFFAPVSVYVAFDPSLEVTLTEVHPDAVALMFRFPVSERLGVELPVTVAEAETVMLPV